jgi:hypothetical protein
MSTKKVAKKNNSEIGKVIGIGAGIAALSAAAYIMFGPNGKKNQKALKGWMIKAKGEIIEKFEQAKELTEPVYHKIVDQIQAKYSKVKNVDPNELNELISSVKKHWKALEKEANSKMKSPKKKC